MSAHISLRGRRAGDASRGYGGQQSAVAVGGMLGATHPAQGREAARQRFLCRPLPTLARMYSLEDAQIRGFLEEGTRTGKLGYRAADGRPLVAPVWFVLEEARLVFNTGKDTAKGRALARDPRVAVCVDLEQPPFAYVQVQGIAELSEDPADLVATATAIGARYMGADRAGEFGRRNGVPGELVVRLRPVKVIADFDVTG